MNHSPLKIGQFSIKGKWDREKTWKNKVDEKKFLQWIKQQPTSFSHFTRRLDKKMKWYFTKVDCYQELYKQYLKGFIFNGWKPMSERSFRRYLQKHCQNYRFKKSHLDACSVSIRLKELQIRAKNRQNYNIQLKGMYF